MDNTSGYSRLQEYFIGQSIDLEDFFANDKDVNYKIIFHFLKTHTLHVLKEMQFNIFFQDFLKIQFKTDWEDSLIMV